MTQPFSVRNGLRASQAIQFGSVNEALRADMWNGVFWWYQGLNENGDAWVEQILAGYFRHPVDEVYSWEHSLTKIAKPFILGNAKWFELYDLLEFMASASPTRKGQFQKYFDAILESNCSGYRFSGDVIVPITDEEQLDQIDAAIGKKGPVSEHIGEALRLLSDRKAPNYRDSIKESISAVEAACQAIAGNPSASLGVALKKLPGAVHLHSAFRGALEKLYGWSSDAEGIRHALSSEPQLTSADAVFMLVICSAFANYLAEKARAVGIGVGQLLPTDQ